MIRCIVILLSVLVFLTLMIWEPTRVQEPKDASVQKTEHFVLNNPIAQPLQIDNNIMVNPVGWRWSSSNQTITTKVRFYVTEGEYDYENMVARPQLGFPSKSDGFGYSNWNNLQGTNAWFAWNEGTGGTGWFWWKPSTYWYSLKPEQKRKMLELVLFITNQGVLPDFPVGYSVTCPDYNFNRSVRVWVQFTSNPMQNMLLTRSPHSDTKMGGEKMPPLLIKDTQIVIPKSRWVLLDQDIATCSVPLQANQGEIDWMMIRGKEKNRGDGWFRWEAKQNGVIDITLNNQITPPKFPARYIIEIKDTHRDRYVRATIILPNNPFVNYIEKLVRTPESQLCPTTKQICITADRTRCHLPLLLRQG